MPIEIVQPTVEDADTLGQICYHAFYEIFDSHGLQSDFPDVTAAQGLVRTFVSRSDFYGIAAKLDGQFVGSNFLQLSDVVAGVGPLTVAPTAQAGGIGKALMQHAVEFSLMHHGPHIRLVQDAVNTTSLSLYTSLGFDVVEPLAMVAIAPSPPNDRGTRPATIGDLDAMDELCQRIYGVSRRNELAGLIAGGSTMGMQPFVREQGGRLRAYAVPSFLGHGVGESNKELLMTLRAARAAQPTGLTGSMQAFLCPSRNGDLYRAALKLGGRTIRCLHLMAIGPYDSPQGEWYPSITY